MASARRDGTGGTPGASGSAPGPGVAAFAALLACSGVLGPSGPVPGLPAAAGVAQGAETLREVAYVDDPHPEQHLDFHGPEAGAGSTVLFLHGGSLEESGERRSSPMYRSVCEPFVSSGIACASADYRLAPSFQWPAMPQDVAAAVVKVRELVRARGGDPDRLILFGHSSGCHLAAVVATHPVYLRAVGLEPSSLAGVIPMGCTLDRSDTALRGMTADDIREPFSRDRSDVERYGTPESWIAANPAHHVGGHVPPTLVVLAEAERFFPSILEQGARFVRLLLEEDVPAELVIVPGTHRSSIEDLGSPGDAAFEAIRAFVQDPAGMVAARRERRPDWP